MQYRSYLLVLVAIMGISQFTAMSQRMTIEEQRVATSDAVTDLARMASAVQTYTTQAGGGVTSAQADLTWDEVGVRETACGTSTTDVAYVDANGRVSRTGTTCVETKNGNRYELRRDSTSTLEIVAATPRGDGQSVLARATIRGPETEDIDIEVLR